MQRFLSLAVLLPILTACSVGAINEARYPDRAKFTYIDPEDNTKYSYLCEKRATPAATEAKAKAAHAFVMEKAAETAAKMMLEMGKKMDEGSSTFMAIMSSSWNMQDDAEEMAKEVEAKFQCIVSEVE